MPTIPTDNFYKFFSISGLVLAISSFYFFVNLVYERAENLEAHHAEIQFWSNITQFGAAFGVLVSVIAFTLWYVKVQRPADIEHAAKSEMSLLQLKYEKAKFESKYNNEEQ